MRSLSRSSNKKSAFLFQWQSRKCSRSLGLTRSLDLQWLTSVFLLPPVLTIILHNFSRMSHTIQMRDYITAIAFPLNKNKTYLVLVRMLYQNTVVEPEVEESVSPCCSHMSPGNRQRLQGEEMHERIETSTLCGHRKKKQKTKQCDTHSLFGLSVEMNSTALLGFLS